MTRFRGINAVLVLCVVALTIALSGCGGGGGGGGSGSSSSSIAMITAQALGPNGPQTFILWQSVNGNPVPTPTCTTGVFLNSIFNFDFNGAVDPISLPQSGQALGSIGITALVAGVTLPASGTFAVVDNPNLPAGNLRRVQFAPTPPGSVTSPCAAGLQGATNYSLNIPRAGNSSQVLTVGGTAIQSDANTCFVTCTCPIVAASCSAPFTDPVPGAPFVASTFPTTADPVGGPIPPGTITNNTITILINEALNPSGVTLSNVKLINSTTGAQVPGTVTFTQQGQIPGDPTHSRIQYVASSNLLGGVLYEIVFTSAVVDFGGNPLQTNPGNPSAHLFFQTTPVTFCPQPNIVEDFSSITNRGTVTGALNWNGTGMLTTTFPAALVGTGVDGNFAPPAGQTTMLDTNQTIMVSGQNVSRMGIWNFNNVTVPSLALVRIKGAWFAHWRCLGTVTMNGTINASAGLTTAAVTGDPEQGSKAGAANNGSGLQPTVVAGGVGNAGGGAGGRSSQQEVFNNNVAIRTNKGEDGFGPSFDGTGTNNGSQSNIYYAGGVGGISGFFPSGSGELGGLGGAGGTSATLGGAGQPRLPNASGCGPKATTQVVAQAHAMPSAFIAPISTQSSGSGGGGGGDHLDNASAAPAADDQGGGGGAGGGGLRISSVGSYSQGSVSPAAAGVINANGGPGNTGSTFAGTGGSGSGGEVWIQSFSNINITTTSTINVDGVAALASTLCSDFAAGGAGEGTIQLEAGTNTPNSSFNRNAGSVLTIIPFPFAAGVTGVAISNFLDTGYGAPDYSGASEVTAIGNAPGATLAVTYEGAFEAVTSPGQPDITTLKTMQAGQPITSANMATALDGYRFIRFKVVVGYPAPPTTPQSAILPTVDTITISYSAAINCP